MTDLLARVLAGLDLEGFGRSVAETMLMRAHDQVPELASLRDEQLVEVFAAVSVETVGRLVSASTLLLAVEGDDDPAGAAQVVEAMRAGLALVMAEQVEAGLGLLTEVVAAWDRAIDAA